MHSITNIFSYFFYVHPIHLSIFLFWEITNKSLSNNLTIAISLYKIRQQNDTIGIIITRGCTYEF